MNATAMRLLRVPVTVLIAWGVLASVVPPLMTLYAPYVMRPGFECARGAIGRQLLAAGQCRSLADLYGQSFLGLFVDSAARSLALLAGAAVIAAIVGTSLGIAAALLRRRAIAGGAVVGATTLLAAVPAFFVAYFLQIFVITVGASHESRERLLPVYGFGWDEHMVLPLLTLSIPALAYVAQLTATRLADVLDTDFITTARAKGLRMSWIVLVHALPHVRPVLFEAMGSGLRVAVASLPIVEYIFLWRGVGQLALEAIGIHDAAGFVFTALVLTLLFASLSALADLARPRALFRSA